VQQARGIQTAITVITIGFLVAFFQANWDGMTALFDLVVKGIGNIPDFLQNIIDYYGEAPADGLRSSLLVGGVAGVLLTAFTGWLYLKESRRTPLVVAILLGGIAGMFGSQILLYPMQHCTYLPEAPATQYRLGLLITLAGAAAVLVPLWTVLFRRSRTIESSAGHFKNWGAPYLLLMPSLLVLIVFLYYPGIQILTLSLKSKRFPLPQERFVCLDNYVLLSKDAAYRNSFMTTVLITLAIIVFTMSFALIAAMLASQKIKWIGIYRTLLIWPFALSPVVTGVIFLAMFREGRDGLINFGLDRLFGISPAWLTDSSLAPWVVILASVWNALGFNILFYIAGLQNVPQDLLDAAAIDGANRAQRFVRITFPLLSPFTFFLLVVNITYGVYGIYGAVDALTQGGPPLGPGGVDGGATQVLIYKLYEDAFGSGAPIGQAAAQALILFLMVAGVTMLQFGFVERRVTYSA
jgi:sn-glycerol 3-phosphate transport system permease protein